MSKTIQYLNMCSKLTVGPVSFDHISSAQIDETITELGNKATITLPRNLKKLNGRPVLDYIKAGDRVVLQLGYNDHLNTEFKGYVAVIDAEMPLVLHCDDDYYTLKQNNWVKAYKSVTLKALLQEIVTGYTIECPDVTLGKFQIDNASTYEVLKKVQDDYGVFSRIIGTKLVVEYPYDWTPTEGRWILHRQKNVRESNLKWKRKGDWKTRILVKYWEGKKLKTYIVGDPSHGATIKKVGHIAASQSEAKKLGESVQSKSTYDGYTGNITSFGIPLIHAGDAIDHRDDQQPERAGVYLVDKTSISYTESGFKRECTLAHRIDKID